MRSSATGATALLAALALLPATPVIAGTTSATSGCVSDVAYGKLAVGQRLAYVRRTAGDGAQMSMRRWTSGAGAYQERRYRMCTPTDAAHGALTVRSMRFQGVWRTQIVDTMVGPEPN